MPDLSAISPDITRQQAAAIGRSKPGQVTGKLKVALDAMVRQGLKRGEAAKAAGLTDHALYTAFTRPHVRSYYFEQLKVLRTSEKARNIHTLASIRDESGNAMARVNAVKALEQLDELDETRPAGAASAPGMVVVVIGNAAQSAPVTIEGEPIRDT